MLKRTVFSSWKPLLKLQRMSTTSSTRLVSQRTCIQGNNRAVFNRLPLFRYKCGDVSYFINFCVQQRNCLECSQCRTHQEWSSWIDLQKGSQAHLVVLKKPLVLFIAACAYIAVALATHTKNNVLDLILFLLYVYICSELYMYVCLDASF